jgi:predicted ATPase
MNALALALDWAAMLGNCERNPAEVDRLASELIELSTRHNFVLWLAIGTIYRGWARSASGDAEEGIARIEEGIRDYRATGATQKLPFFRALKAEALHIANRTSESVDTISEAQSLVERSGELYWYPELQRLRAVFLAAMGAEESQIETSFKEAIRTAKKQKSVSLQIRAQVAYKEYLRQKASAPRGRGIRLPL